MLLGSLENVLEQINMRLHARARTHTHITQRHVSACLICTAETKKLRGYIEI
jgi:hypothetical protein